MSFDLDAAMQAIKEAGEVLADFASGGGYLPQDVDEQRAAIISAAEGLVAEVERLRELLREVVDAYDQQTKQWDDRGLRPLATGTSANERWIARARAALGEQ